MLNDLALTLFTSIAGFKFLSYFAALFSDHALLNSLPLIPYFPKSFQIFNGNFMSRYSHPYVKPSFCISHFVTKAKKFGIHCPLRFASHQFRSKFSTLSATCEVTTLLAPTTYAHGWRNLFQSGWEQDDVKTIENFYGLNWQLWRHEHWNMTLLLIRHMNVQIILFLTKLHHYENVSVNHLKFKLSKVWGQAPPEKKVGGARPTRPSVPPPMHTHRDGHSLPSARKMLTR